MNLLILIVSIAHCFDREVSGCLQRSSLWEFAYGLPCGCWPTTRHLQYTQIAGWNMDCGSIRKNLPRRGSAPSVRNGYPALVLVSLPSSPSAGVKANHPCQRNSHNVPETVAELIRVWGVQRQKRVLQKMGQVSCPVHTGGEELKTINHLESPSHAKCQGNAL